MPTDTFEAAFISDATWQAAKKITLAELLECELLTLTVVRSICILRKEILMHQLTEEEDQRLETKLTSLFHSLSVEQRNAAFAERPKKIDAA
jgi:hypothetical protein